MPLIRQGKHPRKLSFSNNCSSSPCVLSSLPLSVSLSPPVSSSQNTQSQHSPAATPSPTSYLPGTRTKTMRAVIEENDIENDDGVDVVSHEGERERDKKPSYLSENDLAYMTTQATQMLDSIRLQANELSKREKALHIARERLIRELHIRGERCETQLRQRFNARIEQLSQSVNKLESRRLEIANAVQSGKKEAQRRLRELLGVCDELRRRLGVSEGRREEMERRVKGIEREMKEERKRAVEAKKRITQVS